MTDIKGLKENIFNHRKSLNCIAEKGRKEFKTSKYIRAYLDKIGIKYDVYIQTATTGIIKGNVGNKTIAFRADIDGLTTEDGVKHLCGHDGHTSILLGLLEFINENKANLNDNIVFIFQPAEEGPGGASALIEEGIMNKYNIDEIYGLHIYPEIEKGYVGIREGYFMAQIGDFDINIVAKSGHGAMPQNGIDGIVIASNLVNSLQTIVSRNVSPIDTAVLSIGTINGGTKRNIIAENVELKGTIRTFNPKVYNNMKERLKEISKGFELSYNCKINVEIRDDYPSVNNDKKLVGEFIEAIGKDKIIELDPLMISEDFSYYQMEVPGLFFMLGSREEQKGFVHGLHSLNFNFDEEVLVEGVEIYMKLLNHKGIIKI